ncbi:MAG: DUF378 domain-containing protein [Nanoarchaeota archaeon]
MARKNKLLCKIATVLSALGAINWGLGIWNINLVEMWNFSSTITNVIYGAIGLAGIYTIIGLFKK